MAVVDEKPAAWAKLVSLNPKHKHAELVENEFFIGRNERYCLVLKVHRKLCDHYSECGLFFPDDKLISAKHCKIFRDPDDKTVFFLQDLRCIMNRLVFSC
jgi:hypothetical protein